MSNTSKSFAERYRETAQLTAEKIKDEAMPQLKAAYQAHRRAAAQAAEDGTFAYTAQFLLPHYPDALYDLCTLARADGFSPQYDAKSTTFTLFWENPIC